jgi:hypothetical protein
MTDRAIDLGKIRSLLADAHLLGYRVADCHRGDETVQAGPGIRRIKITTVKGGLCKA